MTKNKQENGAVKTNNKGVMKTNRKILATNNVDDTSKMESAFMDLGYWLKKS